MPAVIGLDGLSHDFACLGLIMSAPDTLTKRYRLLGTQLGSKVFSLIVLLNQVLEGVCQSFRQVNDTRATTYIYV